MTPREEIECLRTDPLRLWAYYKDLLMAGETLTDEQLIRFEYVAKVASGGM